MIIIIEWFSTIGCIGKEHDAASSGADLANLEPESIRLGMVCLADNGALGTIVGKGNHMPFQRNGRCSYLKKDKVTYIQACGDRQ